MEQPIEKCSPEWYAFREKWKRMKLGLPVRKPRTARTVKQKKPNKVLGTGKPSQELIDKWNVHLKLSGLVDVEENDCSSTFSSRVTLVGTSSDLERIHDTREYNDRRTKAVRYDDE